MLYPHVRTLSPLQPWSHLPTTGIGVPAVVQSKKNLSTREGMSAAIGNDRRGGFLPLLELMSVGLLDRRLRSPRSRPQEEGERDNEREAEAGHEGAGQKVVR